MSGAELKKILAARGIIKASLARQLNMRPQDLNARLNVKNLKVDFLREVEKAVGFKIEETGVERQDQESVPYYVHRDLMTLYREAISKIEELEEKNIQLEKDNAILKYRLDQYVHIEKEKKAVG